MSNIWVAAADNEVDVVKRNLESGVKPDIKDPNGYTPIHAAASYGHIELLRYLVAQGGDINVQDNEGDTPLHHVEDVASARALVEQFGADWKIKNGDGQTAAEYIEEDDEYPEVVEYLRSLAHDKPKVESNHEETFIDTLPQPGTVDGHQIRYTLENDPNQAGGPEIGVNVLSDPEKRKELEEILASDNAEERMKEFLQNAVAQGMADYNKNQPDKSERGILEPKKRRKEE